VVIGLECVPAGYKRYGCAIDCGHVAATPAGVSPDSKNGHRPRILGYDWRPLHWAKCKFSPLRFTLRTSCVSWNL